MSEEKISLFFPLKSDFGWNSGYFGSSEVKIAGFLPLNYFKMPDAALSAWKSRINYRRSVTTHSEERVGVNVDAGFFSDRVVLWTFAVRDEPAAATDS